MANKTINISEIDPKITTHGSSYEWSRKKITDKLDGEKLGASIYELPPGKRAFVYHFHHANEELFFVLEGNGTVRTPEGNKEIIEGDFFVAVTGKEGAHQIINNSDEPLRYLAVSTMIEPEVVEYVDSEKVFVMAGAAPGGEKEKREVSLILRQADATDYWDGEPD